MPTTEEQNEKTIAFVLYPGLTVLDLTGPLQVLTALSEIAPEFRTVVVAERVEPTDTNLPGEMKVIPNNTFGEVPHPLAFIVPGGVTPTLRAMSNEAIRCYVRSAAETAEVVSSVCTGALILGSVGHLEGRQATTHWAFYKVLEQFGATYVRKSGWRTASSSVRLASLRGSTWLYSWRQGSPMNRRPGKCSIGWATIPNPHLEASTTSKSAANSASGGPE